MSFQNGSVWKVAWKLSWLPFQIRWRRRGLNSWRKIKVGSQPSPRTRVLSEAGGCACGWRSQGITMNQAQEEILLVLTPVLEESGSLWPDQGPMATKRQNQYLNPGLSGSKACSLYPKSLFPPVTGLEGNFLDSLTNPLSWVRKRRYREKNALYAVSDWQGILRTGYFYSLLPSRSYILPQRRLRSSGPTEWVDSNITHFSSPPSLTLPTWIVL